MNTELLLKDRKRLFPRTRIRSKLTVEEEEILKAAQDARDEWIDAGAGFEHVHDEMLVDYFIYKLKACESRYIYFVRLAKEKGLTRYIKSSHICPKSQV